MINTVLLFEIHFKSNYTTARFDNKNPNEFIQWNQKKLKFIYFHFFSAIFYTTSPHSCLVTKPQKVPYFPHKVLFFNLLIKPIIKTLSPPNSDPFFS